MTAFSVTTTATSKITVNKRKVAGKAERLWGDNIYEAKR